MKTVDDAALTPAQRLAVCAVINHLGAGDHPYATGHNLRHFGQEYVLECLAKADNIKKLLEASAP